ncbi:major facilitator superfamily domain-containing protein [Blyttiomyces helicus]|uniref:Major facilitator superfamily domain-containing protein n=1 Tax=Blyttiomyces helicus TaxID=388810 RepID=A0A4P9VZ44_9FUNG|nr:major facilitator superfamily domain-containing protein [Blyttiomyces helicus]|eukprot:RKO85034.1 major facilitator superfamily domain-containing protein [Blyttiomyces helicus]
MLSPPPPNDDNYSTDDETDPSDSSPLLSAQKASPPPLHHSSSSSALSSLSNANTEYGAVENYEPNSGAIPPPRPVLAGLGADSWVALAAQLLAEASRGLLLPTMTTYVFLNGGSLGDLGLSISLFSTGRLVATAPFGYWAERRGSREVLLFAAFLAALGNTLYSLCFALPFPLFFLCLSRLIVGIGSGVMGVGRAYLATASKPEDRTRAIAFTGMAQYAGFALSPGLATLLMWLEGAYSKGKQGSSTDGGPTILACILPGVALVILNVCLIPVLLAGMPRRDTLASSTPSSAAASTTSTPLLRVVSDNPPATPRPLPNPGPRLLHYGFILFFGLNFVLRGVIGVTETTAPETYNWLSEGHEDALEESGRFFFILGVLGLFFFFLVDPITRRVMPAYILLVAGTFLVAAGTLLNFDMYPTQTPASYVRFVTGMVMVWSIGSPVCQTLTVSSFSKMLGSRPQGSAISWITVAGSLGRIVFPGLVGLGEDAAIYVNLFDVAACVACVFGIFAFQRLVDTSAANAAAAAQERALEDALTAAQRRSVPALVKPPAPIGDRNEE